VLVKYILQCIQWNAPCLLVALHIAAVVTVSVQAARKNERPCSERTGSSIYRSSMTRAMVLVVVVLW